MRDEEHACGICIDRPRAVRNLPCGHGGICELCTIELVLQALPSGPNCIYCRCTVSRLMVVPVTKATVGAGPVLRPRRMPTNQAVPEPEGHIFESVEAFLLAMLDSADAEVANAAGTALARMSAEGQVTDLVAVERLAAWQGWSALQRAAVAGLAVAVAELLRRPDVDEPPPPVHREFLRGGRGRLASTFLAG